MSHYLPEREIDISRGENGQRENNVWGKEWEDYVSKSEKEDSLSSTTASEEKKTPKHYDNTIQPIEFMYEVMNDDEYMGFCRGNVIKYIGRYPEKGGKLDLEKAKYYLDELLRVY